MIFIIKVTTNKEDKAMEMIEDRVVKKSLNVFSISRPHGLRGYVILEAADRESAEEAAYDLPYVKGIIGKTVTYEQVKNMIEPKVEDIKIEVGDIVEMIGSTFKGEKAKVTRVDKQKGEVVVSLLGASVPIPVTVKIDNVKVIRREESGEKEKEVDDKNKNVEEDEKEFKLSDEVDLL
jgi:transcriptional antiterminator NusG